MKIYQTLLFILFSLTTFAQTGVNIPWEQISPYKSFTITKTRTAADNSGDYLHKIANEFADEVGKKLKENFPAKVKDLDVEILFNRGMYTLTYTATITQCPEGQHHYYFDHRGAFSRRMSSQAAGADAESRRNEQIQPTLDDFKKAYGYSEVIGRIGDGVPCGKECHVYVSEAFIVGR